MKFDYALKEFEGLGSISGEVAPLSSSQTGFDPEPSWSIVNNLTKNLASLSVNGLTIPPSNNEDC